MDQGRAEARLRQPAEADLRRATALGALGRERGTILCLHADGVTMEDDWAYHRAVRPLPVP